MKKIFTLTIAVLVLSGLLLTNFANAQSPEKMSYQAVIRNSTNQLVTNHLVGMKISILQGSASGTVVYTETQTPTTNLNGLVSIEIGGGAGFSTINWGSGLYFIKTETDPAGGTNYTIAGTSQLISVPYSLFAKTAGSISGGITETDPIFSASAAKAITTTNIANWTTAFGWGNHATAGYLKSFTETDPVFGASAAKGITTTNITNWTTAFGWGNHATAGYLKSFTETDPVFGASAAKGITTTNIANWNTAFGWGNHATAGYLKSFTETDPIFSASAAKGITTTNITNWTTAFGWGNHATAGYIKNSSPTVSGDLMTYDGANWVSKKLTIGATGSNQAVSIMQPYLVLNYCIALFGIFPSRNSADPFLGEIELYAFNFEPKGFAQCNGQIMSIAQNTALFALLGTQYGGDGQTTFALPDLRGRVAIHPGAGTGLSSHTIGENGGSEKVTLTISNLPAHTHTVIYQ